VRPERLSLRHQSQGTGKISCQHPRVPEVVLRLSPCDGKAGNFELTGRLDEVSRRSPRLTSLQEGHPSVQVHTRDLLGRVRKTRQGRRERLQRTVALAGPHLQEPELSEHQTPDLRRQIWVLEEVDAQRSPFRHGAELRFDVGEAQPDPGGLVLVDGPGKSLAKGQPSSGMAAGVALLEPAAVELGCAQHLLIIA
jgi:hypothetical protein